jgi:UDP-N-acetylmuramate--alanine ligase
VTVIFQPHLYSRTHDFYREFAESLSLFDEVILTEIYPAREEPIPGVTSALIYDNLDARVQRSMIRKSEVLATVEAKKEELEVLVSLGAGDIENYASQITEILKTTL